MAQNNAATKDIAPLTEDDLKNAADGHYVDVDELRQAVALTSEDLVEWGDEIVDNQVPEDHGGFGQPTVITESEDYISIYVEYGTLARMASNNPKIEDEGGVIKAVGWAHNEYARRHGADADALGAMDAVVLPRTERVETIIAERE